MRKIVLCATQRSGSTMICEDMRNTGILGLPEEYFIPWVNYKNELNYNNQFNNIQKRFSTPNGVFAVKIMADQLASIENGLTQGNINTSQEKIFPNIYNKLKDALWVYIVREDIVRQAISQLIAKKTGVNHAVANKNDSHFAGNLLKGYRDNYNYNVKYDFDQLNSFLAKIVTDNILWNRFFSDWGIKPYLIRYESNLGVEPRYLYDMADFAKVSMNKEVSPRKLVKLSNNKNEELYRLYTNDVFNRQVKKISKQ